MSSSNPVPPTDDRAKEDQETTLPAAASPGFDDSSSNSSTPLGGPGPDSPGETAKRMPQLRSVSDPRNMNPNSTALGVLGMARNPAQAASSFANPTIMNSEAMAAVRSFNQQRLQMSAASSSRSPASPAGQPPSGSLANGFPGNLRLPGGGLPGALPGGLKRPNPPHARSAPVIPKPSLSERRAKMGLGMKLPGMGAGPSSPGTGMPVPGRPKLSDITGQRPGEGQSNGTMSTSGFDEIKEYIDLEKGYITFEGTATITAEGVQFANGVTFAISLKDVQKLCELGKGNYGTVYKVRHAKHNAPRFGQGLSSKPMPGALKAPDPSTEDTTVDLKGRTDGTTGVVMAMKEMRLESSKAKFETIAKELAILHQCKSPYIIDFYGAFTQDNCVYMCIEYMDGGSLDKLYSGGIPENVLRKITYSTVMGLKTLKEDHNIIHRDVKPTNILVNTRGQIKICDFGVSGNLVASIAKTNIGCQSYMAPERISGTGTAPAGNPSGTYSVQSDVWSLGLTIIECAKGAYPYPPEVSSSIFSQLSAIVEGEPPSMPDEGFSDVAKDFVQACLHKVPMKRPTYAQMVKHPWLLEFVKPQTITEEVEEGDEADKAAEAVGKMDLSGTDDAEVANWVKAALRRQEDGSDSSSDMSKASIPALHSAPLDAVSPLASPRIGEEAQ